MVAVNFGHLCFNNQSSEQSIIMVLDSKIEYESMDDFVSKALIYLEAHEDFWDEWTEMYKNRVYSAVDEKNMQWMKTRLDEMNHRISISYETVLNAVYVIPPKWNDITIVLETESEYIFYQWCTTA